MTEMAQFLLIAGLSAIAIQDWQTKEISMVAVGGLAGAGVFFMAAECFVTAKAAPLGQAMTGVLPGMVLLGVSRLTRGAIGEGDGWLMMMVGIYKGAVIALELIWLACFLATLAGSVLLVKKKGSRKTELPWVPFVWLAYMILWIGGAF